MEDQRFDDLTRTLAKPVSRRGMLKVLAAATVGGWFMHSRTGAAWAAEGGNSECAHWCNDHFPPGPDRGECKSDAAHGTGLCHSPCGPDGSGGTLCGGPAYASTTCCAVGSATPVCKGGVCVAACLAPLQTRCNPSTDTCCDTGQGKTICEPNFIGRPNACCNLPGGGCHNNLDCCADEFCFGGICQCTPPTNFCFHGEECCSGTCSGGVCA
jgi:hypothetical protein